MDIDSAARRRFSCHADLSNVGYLRYELTRSLTIAVKPGPWARIQRAGTGYHRTRRWTRPRLGPGLRERRRGRNQSDHRQRRDAGRFQGLFRRHLRPPATSAFNRRWQELRPALVRQSTTSSRHPSSTLGRRRLALHADREHALHRGSLYRLPRSPDRRRLLDDSPMGVRRPPARVARSGSPRGAGGTPPPASRSFSTTGGDVPAEEVAVHVRGSVHALALAERCSSASCMRPAGDPSLRLSASGSRERKPLRYARTSSAPRTATVFRDYEQDIRPRRMTGRSSSTRRARGSVRRRFRPIDAVRQRPQRLLTLMGISAALVRFVMGPLWSRAATAGWPPGWRISARWSRLHADRGGHPAAVRPAARSPGTR